MTTKLIFLVLVTLGLVGCSSSPKVAKVEEVKYPGPVLKLKNYDGPEAMDDNEVLNASRNCILNKMIPVHRELNVRTEYGRTPVVVRVSCVAPLP
jgi:hypothetical protein